MRLIFFITCVAACVSAAQGADFISFDNPGLSRTERLVKLQVIKHRHGQELADAKQYIRNDMDAIVDRIQIPKKPKGEEVYYGR